MNLQSTLVFRNALKAGLAKWGRRNRIRTLEWLGEGNKQKKARRNILFQWISMSPTIHRYRTRQKSHCKHRCYRCQVPKFLQNLSLLLTRCFCPLDTIVIASSARQTFASSPRDVFSFVRSSLFSLFGTGPRSFPWSMSTYNLIDLHLLRKMLGLTMLIN